jgi:hypothetical protein
MGGVGGWGGVRARQLRFTHKNQAFLVEFSSGRIQRQEWHGGDKEQRRKSASGMQRAEAEKR